MFGCNSSSGKPDPVPGKNVSKSPKTQLEYQNCHQPLLLNHQCNKTYYWDDNHEFGYDSDGSNDSAKNWRHMKQSSASARCIPDWQMIVHHNLKSPGIHGVSKNTQTIAH